MVQISDHNLCVELLGLKIDERGQFRATFTIIIDTSEKNNTQSMCRNSKAGISESPNMTALLVNGNPLDS